MTPSPNRRMRHALVALTLAAASAGTAIAVAGPAAAVSNSCHPTATLTINGQTKDLAVRFGSTVTIAGTVAVGTCDFSEGTPSSVEFGTLEIDRTVDNGDTWTVLKTVDVTPEVNTVSVSGTNLVPQLGLYKVTYTGGSSEESGDTFADVGTNCSSETAQLPSWCSWSAPYRTHQRLKSSHWVRNGYVANYKLRPAVSIAGLKVQLQRKQGNAWKTVARAAVDEHGVFSHRFAVGLTRIVTPDARGFVGDAWGLRVVIRHGRTTVRTVR